MPQWRHWRSTRSWSSSRAVTAAPCPPSGRRGWSISTAAALIVGLIFLFIFFRFVQLWIQSLLAGAKVGILDMVRMKLLKIDYTMIVRQKIALVQAGVKVSTQEMEAHFLAGGRVQPVVQAVIAAHKAG